MAPPPQQQAPPPPPPQQPPARPYARPVPQSVALTVGKPFTTAGGTAIAQPAQGIWLRIGPNSSVLPVALGEDRTELRIDRGLVNVSVRHPERHAQILADLPGGQAALLKDGFYTINADTHTVRVLLGEADAYPGVNANVKPVKIKESHDVVFNGPLHSVEFQPFQARADVLPTDNGEGPRYATGTPYGYGPYGDGFYAGYPYPYYAYGYPYYPFGWGYPYGFYPGFGIGFGYYGGFGGFRGRR